MIINLFKAALISLVFQFLLTAQQEYTLSGLVTSISDNEPLPAVDIYIQESGTGTTTDFEGKFSIGGLTPGNYTLKFSYIGFAAMIKTITITADQFLVIRLEHSAVGMDEIVVTGNPFLSDPKEISQTTISLSKMELIIQNNQSVAEALNFQPGIAMRSNGMATGRPVIRGFSDNKVLILEDGLRMGDLSSSSDDHGVSDDGSQPDKIEVLQGPSSLLYGSGAIGGVVNIITDAIPASVQDGVHGEALVQGTSVNNGYLGNLHLNYGTGIFALHGKVFKRRGNNYSIPDGSKTLGSDLESYGTQAGFSVHPEWGIAGLSYTGFNNKYGLPVDPSEGEQSYIDMKKDQYKFSANIFQINSFITSMSLKAGYINYSHMEISLEEGTVGSEFGMDTQTADVSFTHKPFAENSNGVVGLYGLIQKYNVNGEEALTPNSDNKAFAVYFYEKFKLYGFAFSLGARYEFNSIKIPDAVQFDSVFSATENTYNSLSVSLGFTYDLSGSTSLFFNAANAFRAPSVEELSSYGIHKAAADFEIGNRSLAQEKTIGIDAGMRTRAKDLSLELSGFYNSVSNLISKQPLALFYNDETDEFNSESGYRVYQYQQAKSVVYGLQGKLNYEVFKNYTVSFSGDYTKAENLSTNENISMIPPLRFSSELRYSSPVFWYGIKWNLTARQNNVAPEEEPTAGYGILSLYGGIKLMTGVYAHIIDLKINNILNQPYKDHLSAVKHFTYMPGRDFTLNYRLLF